MKHIAFFFLLFALLPAVVAQIQPMKGVALQNAGYSVYVIDAENGNVICETPQVSLVPASVMKLMTTAAALEILGPDFYFHTQIGFAGKIDSVTSVLKGDLVLRGGCDPAFYSEYFPEHYRGTFEAWAEAISQKGIKSIDGDLVIDLTHLEGSSVPGGWLWEDIGNYYGAGVSALTYSDNQYKIHFSSPTEPGKPASLGNISPFIDTLHLINNVLSSEDTSDQTIVYGAPGSFSQVVEGTIPKGITDFVVKPSMPDPAHYAATEFINVLKSNGIMLAGKIRTLDKPNISDFILIADKESPSLRKLIVPLNQESINLFAEHLLREIGRARKGSSALTESVEALKEFWAEKKIFVDGFYPSDGSGLSRSNAICTRTLAEVIRHMYLSVNRDDFFKSLAVAGESGTLKSAFKGSKLEHNLVAKTGSMTRVRSLTGIFTNQKGKRVIFAVITNNFEGKQAVISHTIEGFLNELYTSGGKSKLVQH